MKKAVTTESANVMVCLMQDKKIEPMTGGTYLFLAAEGTNEISGQGLHVQVDSGEDRESCAMIQFLHLSSFDAAYSDI